MWVSTKKNSKGNRFVYRERFTDDTGKTVVLSVTLNSNTRRSQKAAAGMLQEKFEEMKEKRKDGGKHRKKDPTVAEVCQEWLSASDIKVKLDTQRNHRNYVQNILKAIPTNLRLADFSPAKAENIVSKMYYERKLSYSYSSSTLVVIKTVMRYAKKAGYIDNIYDFEEIKLKRRPATPAELEKIQNKFLNKDELRECLDQLQKINERIALAMEFMSLTGLRCGEMLALRKQDVNLEKKVINVNGTIVKSLANGDEAQRGTPKNIYSYRNVDLNQRAVDILRWFILDNKRLERWEFTRNSNSRSYKDRGYIFTTKTGMPMNIQFINHKLRLLNIPGKKISTHIFRHTHISMLAEMNVPLKAIMTRVGHNDPNTTLSIYTHVTNSMRQEMIQKLENLCI